MSELCEHGPSVTGGDGHKAVDALKHQSYLTSMDDQNTLDARGLLCPLPVLKARKRLQTLSVGDELTLHADDPAAIIDVPHFCAESGHMLVSQDDQGAFQVYVIRKS